VQNAFVQAMSDLGIVGLLAFLGLVVTGLVMAARTALRAPPPAAVAALVSLFGLVVVIGVLSALGLVAGIPTDALLWLSLGFCVLAAGRSALVDAR
jgi:O-antigen ligase